MATAPTKPRSQKGVCPSCGKRGLGHTFPSLNGAYRTCTYCGEATFIRQQVSA